MKKIEVLEHSVKLIAVTLLAILIITQTSCSSSRGYGCKGRESWNHMVRRINSY